MILTCTTCFKPSTITLGHGPSKQVPSEDGNARLDKYTQYCRWPSDSHRHVHACTYFIIHFIYYYLLIDAGFKASNTSYLAWCGPQMTHAVRWNGSIIDSRKDPHISGSRSHHVPPPCFDYVCLPLNPGISSFDWCNHVQPPISFPAAQRELGGLNLWVHLKMGCSLRRHLL